VTLELLAAALLGALVLWMVVGPLVRAPGERTAAPAPAGADDIVPVEETRRGQALLAIKELEFDRATGKVSDEDYALMRQRFVDEAVEALREAGEDPTLDEAERLVAARTAAIAGGTEGVVCSQCGPRPEADAVFCSDCGRRVAGASYCGDCGTALPTTGNFCPECGARAPARA